MKYLKDLNKKSVKLSLIDEIKSYILVFIAGGLAGYIYEVLFCLIIDHELVNRGFLYGPFLPVYAWGALVMAILFRKLKKHPVLIFLLAIIITGTIEYFTGVVMEAIWHRRWWDYTGLFLNINGFVCFRSVFTFAIGGLLLMYLVEPLIRRFVKRAEPWIINVIIVIFFSLFLVDNTLSKIYRN